MEYTIKIPDEFDYLLKDKKFLEVMERKAKGKYGKFVKAKLIDKSNSTKEVVDSILKTIEKIGIDSKQSINILNADMDSISSQIEGLSSKADSIVKNTSKSLNYINVISNAADLCATTASFMILSQKMDDISKDLSNISKTVNDISDKQQLLDEQAVKSLLNEYADIQNSESLNIEVPVEKYYNLMNTMSLTIETIKKCFNNDIGNREVYLNCISILLPLYTVSFCNFDRAHYFKYGKFHTNRDNYLKVLDQFANYDFFKAVQEYSFLKDDKVSCRDAFDTAYAYVVRVNEQKVAVSDNLRIVSEFKSYDDYKIFENRFNKGYSDYVINKYANEISPEDFEELKTITASYQLYC